MFSVPQAAPTAAMKKFAAKGCVPGPVRTKLPTPTLAMKAGDRFEGTL